MLNTRVVELSTSLATAYCGWLLRSLGADVTVAVRPEGHPLRRLGLLAPDGVSTAWHCFMRDKALAPVEAVDLAAADVLLSDANGDPGAAIELEQRFRAFNPDGVHVALSGFGLTGPYASYRHSALIDWSVGGYQFLTGDADREPLAGGGPWASCLHGATAAVGVLAGLASGRGQLVDSSAMEALAAAHQWSWVMWTHTGVVKGRWGNRHGESHHPLCFYECGDGRWVCVGVATGAQWEAFCLATDSVKLLADDSLAMSAVRFDRADEIDAVVRPWLQSHNAGEVVAALQAQRCPAGLVQDFTEVVNDAQLAHREFWVVPDALGTDACVPRAPFRLEIAAEPPGPSPTVRAPARGLAGLRVLEFGVAWAGPLTCRILGDLGADIIKIEHPTSRGVGGGAPGDAPTAAAARHPGELPAPEVRPGVYPDGEPGERWWNRQGWFNKVNRAKRSLCLDVKAGGGREILRRLVENSDVVVNNYSPRGVNSLGIDHASLRRWNPLIVTVAMSGYGATGPMASHFSWGPILEAHAGTAAATGYVGDGPVKFGVAFPDPSGGVHGALAVLAALHERDRTGRAVHVDLSQLETLLAMAGPEVLDAALQGKPPERRGNGGVAGTVQGTYRCLGDDSWVSIRIETEADWQRLCEHVASPILAGVSDPAAETDIIDGELARWTAGRTKWDAQTELQGIGLSAMAVHTNRDLVESPHLQARGFPWEYDQPEVGVRSFPGSPLHFSAMDIEPRPCPPMGADNRTIVVELLGYTDADFERLTADGTLTDKPPW